MAGYTTHRRATSHISCPKCAPEGGLRVDSNKPLGESLPERPQRRRPRLRDRCLVGCNEGLIAVSSSSASKLQSLLTAGEIEKAVKFAVVAVRAYRENRNEF